MPFHCCVIAVAATLLAALAGPAGGQAADRNATPANFASVVSSARGGEVIHLAAGDYGSFAGASKPSMVTIKAEAGVQASIAANLQNASNLRFEGLQVTHANIERSTGIEFVGNTFTGPALIDTTDRNGDHAILFDSNTHDGIAVCSTCYEGRITVHGSSINTTPVGVTIRNSHFGGGGNSDGIQVGSYGVEILGNEFADLRQGDPRLAHTDAIQLYGQSHTVIRGNYMHNVATGILCADGCDNEIIEHNVILTIDSYPGVLLGPDRNSIIRHNTFPAGPVRVDDGNGPGSSSGTVIRDNIIDSYDLKGTGLKAEFNLVADGSKRASSDMRANPVFVGGARPTMLAGYRLADLSPGKGSASDGTDRGADVSTMGAAARAGGGPPVTTPAASSSGVTISVRRRISWDRVRRGLRLRIRATRPVQLRLALIPKGRRHALARRRVDDFPVGVRTVVVRPKRKLLGMRRSRTLTLRVKIVDPAGAATYRRFTIHVRR
jgi:hypothetical protein